MRRGAAELKWGPAAAYKSVQLEFGNLPNDSDLELHIILMIKD